MQQASPLQAAGLTEAGAGVTLAKPGDVNTSNTNCCENDSLTDGGTAVVSMIRQQSVSSLCRPVKAWRGAACLHALTITNTCACTPVLCYVIRVQGWQLLL